MKVATVVGARPQFIKAAAVTRVFGQRPDVTELIIHTGQHYDPAMSQVFFDELNLPVPYVNAAVGSGPHGEQTGRMLEVMERVLVDMKPDVVLIYGDTNSTLAGALAAVKLHIPVAHVEAGLRSFNRRMPEEINRVVTDHVSSILFAPTEAAIVNLANEGIREDVHLTGDVMFDATLYYTSKAEKTSRVLENVALTDQPYVLATMHRAENTDDPARLAAIWGALCRLSSDCRVVLPLHPRTRKKIAELGVAQPATLRIIEPVGYLDMLKLEAHARLVVTDSGGVQKEAFFNRVPCVTLRSETEWVELVDSGWNRLVAEDSEERIFSALAEALHAENPQSAPSPYGDGEAARRIVDLLISRCG